MSTQRINALPSGTATFTATARLAYEDANDETNKTKFLNVTSLGTQFLPLAGGTMSGDIDMNINDINEIGTLLFNNIGTGANPSFFSDTDGARQLSFNGDLIVLTDGKLGFGNNFLKEDALLGAMMRVQDVSGFTFDFLGTGNFEVRTAKDTPGDIVSRFESIGEDENTNTVLYSSFETKIIDNTVAGLSASVNFLTAFGGSEEQAVLGLNIINQKEVFIYDNIRFNNLGTGTDPTLFADSASQALDLAGSLDMGSDINMRSNDINFRGTNHVISSTIDTLSLTYDAFLIFDTLETQSSVQFKSTQQTNTEFAFFDFVAKNTSSQDIIYGGISAKINNSITTEEDASWQFLVQSNSIQDVPILGMNVDSDKAVKIFNSARFFNSGTGGANLDSFIESNNSDTQQILRIKGSVQHDFTEQAPLGQTGTITYQGFHSTPVANNTTIARFDYFDRNSLGQNRQYLRIEAMVENATTVDGGYLLQVRTADSLISYITINANSSGLTAFNQPISLTGNEITKIGFVDFTAGSDPGAPTAGQARIFVETIDANNEQAFFYLKKLGVITKVFLA